MIILLAITKLNVKRCYTGCVIGLMLAQCSILLLTSMIRKIGFRYLAYSAALSTWSSSFLYSKSRRSTRHTLWKSLCQSHSSSHLYFSTSFTQWTFVDSECMNCLLGVSSTATAIEHYSMQCMYFLVLLTAFSTLVSTWQSCSMPASV